MSGEQRTDLKAMSVAEIKNYLQERGVSVNGYLKPNLVEIAVAVKKMTLPLDPNFQKVNNVYTMKQRLNIHHLIYHATDYDKQGLAAYKSFEDCRLFQDGYVRSLEMAHIREAGVDVYIYKVQPSMRTKTDDGKECYSLWFILEGRRAYRGSVLDAYCKCKGGRDGGGNHIAAAR
jgi:hypothetical protein